MAQEQKCAHPACTCTAAQGDQYCSPRCRDAAQNTTSCNCGHAGCAGKMASGGGSGMAY